MAPNGTCTFFAPPERAAPEEVRADYRRLAGERVLREIFEAIPHVMALLNRHRQVVFFNQALLDLLHLSGEEFPWGLRIGELLHCAHAAAGPGGCGTAEACRYCGQARAVLRGLAGGRAVEQVRIVTRIETRFGALDLAAVAVPFAYDGVPYVLTTLYDISAEKRREALERIFFHDVLNTATLVLGYSELLAVQDPAEQAESARVIAEGARQVVREIDEQREIAAAESGDLRPHPRPVDSLAVVRRVVDLFGVHPAARERRLRVSPEAAAVRFETDPTLLQRVLENMVKNALEAIPAGAEVDITCAADGDRVRFAVHNPTPMPRVVQLQVFQRSFSTKGPRRGLGTYSMRLLAEQYLAGRVWFASDEAGGTTFFVELPRAVRRRSFDGNAENAEGPERGRGDV